MTITMAAPVGKKSTIVRPPYPRACSRPLMMILAVVKIVAMPPTMTPKPIGMSKREAAISLRFATLTTAGRSTAPAAAVLTTRERQAPTMTKMAVVLLSERPVSFSIRPATQWTKPAWFIAAVSTKRPARVMTAGLEKPSNAS